ncbi:MAG: hypothetical protein Q9185_005731 [Variospora sp. 1 TL-2023]
MPIPQNPQAGLLETTEPPEFPPFNIIEPNSSEGSIKAEICDGPLSPAAPWDVAETEKARPRIAEEHRNGGGVCTSDRNELIERIKRGETPTWIPSQTVCPMWKSLSGNTDDHECTAELSPPSEIKRPRSALHSGDFNRGTQDVPAASQRIPFAHQPGSPSTQDIFGTSPPISWYSLDPSSKQSRTPFSASAYPAPDESGLTTPRSRAPSINSYSSSFVPRAPTTPLVQQSNSTDIDFSPIDLSINPSTSNRRHTLPPRPLQSKELFSHDQASPDTSTAHRPPSLRGDPTYPFQTHRPRRSLTTTYSLQASPTSQKPPFLRSRRQSLSTEASPLQSASMIGSYEESILRGWMSTAPSKPLDFTAQIGVLGRSNCKPRCPAHVTVPFPAVFYSWGGGTGRRDTKVDDEPSPYVGHIDLQQLPTPAESKKTHRSRSKSPPHTGHFPAVNNTPPERNARQADQSTRRHEKRRRASSGPSGLQGGYRIPREGQLQIVIKNPNKTAVKLFLVPYNLEDMEGGSKTFIRQRCYSADPVVDAMPSNSAEREFSSSGKAGKSKPTLRYLIHVNICSPSTGRFYLYQHIRVVFANRVPDNKEQLQTEIHVPQPRYSAYNPKFPLSRSISGSGARLMKDKVHKRHSSGFSAGLEAMGDENFQTFKDDTGSPVLLDSPPARKAPVASIPFHLTSRRVTDSDSGPQADSMDKLCGIIPALGTKEASELPVLGNSTMSACSAIPFDCSTIQRQWTCADQHESGGTAGCEPMDMDTQFNRSSLTNKTNRPLSPSTGDTDGIYGKISKRGARYAGQPLRPRPGEGLLARKLKGLGMQKENREEL